VGYRAPLADKSHGSDILPIITNNNFDRLVDYLKSGKASPGHDPSQTDKYKAFIAAFPASKLLSLTLDQYCVGKQTESFCWWIERGLEEVLGRYMPGTAKGHILYFLKDGSVYKHRALLDLSDLDALAYTLKIQSVIANADPTGDLNWIDDDAQLYQRAGVPPRVTIGEGRKLRLLSCYNPQIILPISSSDHVGHFLETLGCPTANIPNKKSPVARSLLLREYWEAAKAIVANLTPWDFMNALYRSDLGLAPVKEAESDDKDVVDSATHAIPVIATQRPPLNQILYGPPGTGKTFATINTALEILDPAFLHANSSEAKRKELKERFDELSDSGQIQFVTFHQSFSYEDFVEGLRAGTDVGGQLRYDVADGVFKLLCKSDGRAFNPGDTFGNYVVRKVTPEVLVLEKPNGNLLPFALEMIQTLADLVRRKQITIEDIRDKTALDKAPESHLEPYLVNGYVNVIPMIVEHLIKHQTGNQASTEGALQSGAKVLIIDEINRGNVSRIFGELISLIEPSKRAGQDESLEVVLPYSKQRFSVPANLYIIGTMNTADRSLSGVDIALRRRFVFKEMAPESGLLASHSVEGVNLGELLTSINRRIEALLDRDHCIGHAYFLPLRANNSLEALALIFRQQIIPLLQEYFFEDWERIHWILNDHNKSTDFRFILQSPFSTEDLFGTVPGLGQINGQWQLQAEAFYRIESYQGIIKA